MDSDPEYLFTESMQKLLLTDDNCERIINFVLKNIDAEEVVVNCDYGESRSPAVGLFVVESFFDQANKEYWLEWIERERAGGRKFRNE